MKRHAALIFVLWTVITCDANIFPALPVTVEKGENIMCNQHSIEYLKNLNNFTLWSYEMRDASAQSTTSVLRGSGFSMGNLEQCLTANAPFPTQYCLTIIVANVPKTATFRDSHSLLFDRNENVINKLYDYKDDSKAPRNIVKMGWCIPASCPPTEAENTLNNYLKNYDNPFKKENVTFSASVPPVLCQTSFKQNEIDSVDLGFCVLTAILLLLVVSASIWDSEDQMSCLKEKSLLSEILLAFSFKRNFEELQKYNKTTKPLKILYGLKTFCLFMVIAGHRFGLFAGSPVISHDFLEESYRNTWGAAIYHSDLFVDTFFFISGLLVTYIVMGLIDKKIFRPGLIILQRYLRLTPAYAFVIFYQATLLYHTGTGALWEAILGAERADCRANWWTGILYISNLVNSTHMCITQSWYLSCDFHYFLLALLLVYLLHKNKIIGFAGIGLLSLATIIALFYLTYANERPPFLLFSLDFLTGPKQSLDFQLTYIKTYTRGLPYFVGIIAGYIYYKLKGTDFSISKIQFWSILCISFFVICLLIFTGVIFYDPYHKYDVIESSIYGSVHRLLWALGTLGFVYAISFSSPGIIYNFLSLDVFVPLSKLSYGAYLLHMGVQLRDIASAVGPRKYDFFDVFLDWLSDTVFAFMLAFVLYLTVEEPFKKIIMILLRRKTTINNYPEKVESDIENSKM